MKLRLLHLAKGQIGGFWVESVLRVFDLKGYAFSNVWSVMNLLEAESMWSLDLL